MMQVLPRPAHHEDRAGGPEIWVDEAIWGHRLYDEQTPWLALLEFLCVLGAQHKAQLALKEPQPNSLSYKPQTQLKLRNLLFNNPYLAPVCASGQSEDAMWASWLAQMNKNAGGLQNPDFSYLKSRFNSFQEFADVIAFLQGSAIEGDSNKRWSSKFVFPFGPNAFYEDVSVSATSTTNDRRFFARAGELLYLMLCRSKNVDELRPLVVQRLLEGDKPYNSLIAVLQGDPQYAQNERAGSYLPCKTHAAFDRLGEDWASILRLDMPVYDAIPHLVTMTGLSMLLYQLERASEELQRVEPIVFVCEIVSPKRSVVRDLAANAFQENNALSLQAVAHFINSIKATQEWQSALASEAAPLVAAELLERHFDWSDLSERQGIENANPARLLEELVEKAESRHKQHVGKVHGTWARLLGLSSRRSSRRVRYAPTDRLLKTLVICCVDQRLEFKDFLELIYERYGLIIGHKQAQYFIDAGAADQKDFEENARRLEERLGSLGLLKRLSDSCAYVENPFQRKALS